MRSLVGMLLLCTLPVGAQSLRTLTLEQAIALGTENNALMRISRARVEGATAKAGEAHASLLPSVRIEGGYRRLSEIDPFRIQPPGFPAPFTVSPVVLDNYALRATLQQPLFTGFRLRSTATASEHLVDASEYDRENDKTDLVLSVTGCYWALYQTMEMRQYVDENVVRLQADLQDVQHLMNAGLATRNDVLKIQVQLSSARLAQIDAAHDVQVATLNLNNVLGFPLDTKIILASAPGPLSGVPSGEQAAPSIEVLVTKALESRPDVMALRSRTEASRAGVRAAQGGWWPQIFLSGNYYYSRPNNRIMPTLDQFKGTWDVGVTVQLDVWNWGATWYQTEQAQAGVRQQEAIYNQLRDNIAVEIQRQSLMLQRAGQKTEVARLAVDQAEENLRATKDKFRTGLATSSDLLDAEVAFLQSRATLTGALVEYELSKARLAKAVGEGR